MAKRPKTQPEINKFRRDNFIEATLRVVAESGIENTTIAKICDAAGVSRGLANHYFSDKNELLAQAFQSLLDDVNEVTASAAGQVSGSAVNQLHAIIGALFGDKLFSSTSRSAYLHFWAASLTDSRLLKMNRAAYRRFHAAIADLIERAALESGMQVDKHEAALGMVGMVDGLWLDLSLGVDDISRRDAIKACTRYADLLIGRTDHAPVIDPNSAVRKKTVVARAQ